MLCIALVAVFVLDVAAEAASPCSNADCSAACDMGACDDQGEDGAPCVKHHCCHGTTASEPDTRTVVAEEVSSDATPIARDQFAASSYLDALERPPRTATVI